LLTATSRQRKPDEGPAESPHITPSARIQRNTELFKLVATVFTACSQCYSHRQTSAVRPAFNGRERRDAEQTRL